MILTEKNDKKAIEQIMKQIADKVYPETGRWHSKWNKELIKDTSVLAILSNGKIVRIKKPYMERTFCFGYGFCGVSDREDYKIARNAERNCRTNPEYFKKENFKEIDRKIEDLLKYINGKIYKIITESCFHEFPGLVYVRTINSQEDESIWSDGNQLSKEDAKEVLGAYQEARNIFEKRLDTYLKKYGLDKLKTSFYKMEFTNEVED